MPKPKKQKPEPSPQSSDPADEGLVETDVLPEPETNGHVASEPVEPVEAPEPPAKVKYSAEGSPRAVAAAARKIANVQAAPVTTPASDPEPPIDDTDALMADGKNMVLVRRTFPKTVEMQDGSKRRCAVKLPDRYDCPTTREKIENDIFERYGGSEYKCTIHPATTNGDGTLLGFFVIEHPNSDEPPYFPDDPPQEAPPYDSRTSLHTSGGDPTMHETDGLAKLRADAERRLDRARVRKEMKELEAEAKRLEEEIDGVDKKPPAAPIPPGESDEIQKLREQNAQLSALLAEKKVNDRFDKLEDSIAKLATAVAAGGTTKPTVNSDETFAMQMVKQSQQHSKDMMTLMQDKVKPAAATHEGDFDKFLDRYTKLQTITGGGPAAANKSSGRLSELESKLIDMSFDRLTGGGGGDGDDDDGGDPFESAVKLAIKEFAPIAKVYVDKKMEHENAASGGQPLSKEQIQKIYAEAAQAAAKKVQDDLALQGLTLQQTPDGRLIAVQTKSGGKPVVPPRSAGTKVMSETRTAGGVVRKISIQPENLTGRPKPDAANEAPAPEPTTEPTKGEAMPKCGVFPMLGPNGTEIKIEFPTRPGDLKYDRKYSVNFILDGIRSEIRQGLPQKAQTDAKIESYVIGDAIEYLDDEILNQLDGVDSGQKLESLLGPSGDADKIAEIKKAGEDEVVASYLRKLVLSIQREWQREK